MPSKKNGYRPPVCTDERLRYINIECGECYECRKKRAREWKIRMSEEMRHSPSAIFFTGTFTDERIEQLCKKYDINKENVNVSIDIPVTLPNLFLIGLNAPVTTISPVVGC